MAVGKVQSHGSLRACAVEFARPSSDEILGGGGRVEVCQPVLQRLSHERTELAFGMGLAFTDGAEQLCVERELQRVGPSG
jgi:hypothetical protein